MLRYRTEGALDNGQMRQRVLEIHRRLVDEYGEPERRSSHDPVGQLVSTILSQNTNDTNRDRAYRRLRERFASWEAVRDADLEEIKEAIRVSGLANQKGASIQRALRHISADQGKLSLDFLKELSVPEAKAWLTEIKGVGPKTAAIVLLFALGMPAFPVDTHVHRVSKRLGIIGPKVSREQAHEILEGLVKEKFYYTFHINLIRHGRQVCVARDPRCEVCVLGDACAYYEQIKQGKG